MKKQKDIVNFCSVRLQALFRKVASSQLNIASSQKPIINR